MPTDGNDFCFSSPTRNDLKVESRMCFVDFVSGSVLSDSALHHRGKKCPGEPFTVSTAGAGPMMSTMVPGSCRQIPNLRTDNHPRNHLLGGQGPGNGATTNRPQLSLHYTAALHTMEELRMSQRVRRSAAAVLKAAAKRSVAPTLVYHARVLASAAARLRPSILHATRRLAASVACSLFVLKHRALRAGARCGAAVRQWRAAVHTQKLLSGIRLACAIRWVIQSAEVRRRTQKAQGRLPVGGLHQARQAWLLGRYAAGKRLLLAARRMLKKRWAAYQLAAFIKRGKLGKYAAGKRLLLSPGCPKDAGEEELGSASNGRSIKWDPNS